MLTDQAHSFVDQLAKLLELVGVAIIVAGIIFATVMFFLDGSRKSDWRSAYPRYVPISDVASCLDLSFSSVLTSSPQLPLRSLLRASHCLPL